MSETPDTTTTATSVAATPAASDKPYWVYRLAAWVAIVAGIVFTVAVIFFSGAALTHHDGWHGHHHGHHHAMFHPGHHRQHPGPGFGGPERLAPPGPGQPPSTASPSIAPQTP